MRLFKNKIFLTILFVIGLIITAHFSGIDGSRINYIGNVFSVVVSPFRDLFSSAVGKVSNSSVYLEDVKSLKDENAKLKAKIDSLEKDNAELTEYRKTNKELKAALNIKEQFSNFEFIGANITAKDIGNWFNVFTIDRGTKDGIDVNYPVITNKGLVGRIKTSDIFSSKVITIIDEDSAVSARITKTRDEVIVKGDIELKEQGLCRMDYIPTDVDISVDDTIETSGLGTIFPKGIIIGKVKEVRQSSNDLSRYAVIQPTVDFKRLEDVLILKDKNISQR